MMAWLLKLVDSSAARSRRSQLSAHERQIAELRGSLASSIKENRASRYELREALAQSALDLMQTERGP